MLTRVSDWNGMNTLFLATFQGCAQIQTVFWFVCVTSQVLVGTMLQINILTSSRHIILTPGQLVLFFSFNVEQQTVRNHLHKPRGDRTQDLSISYIETIISTITLRKWRYVGALLSIKL